MHRSKTQEYSNGAHHLGFETIKCYFQYVKDAYPGMPIISIGSGNGKLEKDLMDDLDIHILCIDQNPLSWSCVKTLYVRPVYDSVQEMLDDELVINDKNKKCIVFLNWSTISDTYDIKAIKLLKPVHLIVITETGLYRGASSPEFHQLLYDSGVKTVGHQELAFRKLECYQNIRDDFCCVYSIVSQDEKRIFLPDYIHPLIFQIISLTLNEITVTVTSQGINKEDSILINPKYDVSKNTKFDVSKLKEGYEGACVYPPRTDYFSSLYPSSKIGPICPNGFSDPSLTIEDRLIANDYGKSRLFEKMVQQKMYNNPKTPEEVKLMFEKKPGKTGKVLEIMKELDQMPIPDSSFDDYRKSLEDNSYIFPRGKTDLLEIFEKMEKQTKHEKLCKMLQDEYERQKHVVWRSVTEDDFY